MKITNKFLIDGIQSTHYEQLILKNKHDIKSCCPRLLKNILIAVNKILFAIIHGKKATPKSLAQHGLKHIQQNHLPQDQLDDVKTIIAYSIAHMKNGSDKDQLNKEFAALIKKSTTVFSKTKSEPSKTPTPVKSTPSKSSSSVPSEPSKVSIPVNSNKSNTPTAANPKYWDTALPPALISSIESFIQAPSATTALAHEDQGCVFQVAINSGKTLTDEHLKYLRKADTFHLDDSQTEEFIQKVFDNCKNIKFVVIEPAPAPYSMSQLRQWKTNVSRLMQMNPQQPFLCVLSKQNVLVSHTIGSITVEDTEKFLAILNDSSKETVIKYALKYNDFKGKNAGLVHQLIQDPPLDSILSLANDLVTNDPAKILENLIAIRQSSIIEIQDILDKHPIDIIDAVTKYPMKFWGDVDAEKNMELIAYRAYRDLNERGPQTIEKLLNKFGSAVTKMRFLKKFMKTPQSKESIKALLEILANAKYPLGRLVPRAFEEAFNTPDAIEDAFTIFFQNFAKFQGQESVSNFELFLNLIDSEEKLLSVLKAVCNNLLPHEEQTVLKWIVSGSSFFHMGATTHYKIPLSKQSIHDALVSVGGRIGTHYSYAYDATLRQEFTTEKAVDLMPQLLKCKNFEQVKQLYQDNLPSFVPATDYNLFVEETVKNCPPNEFEALFQLLIYIHSDKTRVARFITYASSEQTDLKSFFAILKKYLDYFAINSEETDFIFQKIIPACSTQVLENLEAAIPSVTSDEVTENIKKTIEAEKELRTL